MLVNNYLSVAMFQLSVELKCDSREEYLVETNEALKQIENCLEVIREYGPDISLFPEMTYVPKFEKEYQELSRTRIIVAGSFYKECINTTVVFADGMKYEIAKGYASGAEPMARKISFCPPEEFISEQLEQHSFWIKGKKIYILNCMEYYHAAYYIARNRGLNNGLFGIFAICSNSNTRVFEEETVCIHNHNERIYTFVLNCVGTYQGKKYADGKSYIYGPVSIHEKEWLREQNIESKQNVSHILSMSDVKAQFLFGKFVFAEELSRFGRSDSYLNNPRDIVVEDIRRE
ncbi:MAG: hypothetical protein IKK43_06280 [Clostridia bacterium]|nr:hypothetical protein [Clostridia bacterium]